MKTIGLLGGTGWPSTMSYYRLLNELVNERLGGYHSAKIILKSIDCHDIKNAYGKDHQKLADLLHSELLELYALNPDGIIICCNSLHKYYDMVKYDIYDVEDIPVFHAIDLVAQHIAQKQYKKVLLLGTKFTMEDGFFAKKLEDNGAHVIVPNQEERDEIDKIHDELMHNIITEDSRNYFRDLIVKYKDADAVILGCTEFPLVIDQKNSVVPLIDPVCLQVVQAVNFALQ